MSTLKAMQSVVQAGEHHGTATPESLQSHLSDFRHILYSIDTAWAGIHFPLLPPFKKKKKKSRRHMSTSGHTDGPYLQYELDRQVECAYHTKCSIHKCIL